MGSESIYIGYWCRKLNKEFKKQNTRENSARLMLLNTPSISDEMRGSFRGVYRHAKLRAAITRLISISDLNVGISPLDMRFGPGKTKGCISDKKIGDYTINSTVCMVFKEAKDKLN